MVRFLTVALPYPRHAVVFWGLIGVAGCSLTEAVRTMPGAPGEMGFFGDGGSPTVDAGSGGASGVEGGVDARADGARDGSKGGRGGSSGRASGGVTTTDAAPFDGAIDHPRACPVNITFACHDYCGALSLAPECRTKLRASARLGPAVDGGDPIVFTDAGPIYPPTLEQIVEKCKCDCELRYRKESCRSKFDDTIMCGVAPLTLICSSDPTFEQGFPSVVGPCGSVRAQFLTCLDKSPGP